MHPQDSHYETRPLDLIPGDKIETISARFWQRMGVVSTELLVIPNAVYRVGMASITPRKPSEMTGDRIGTPEERFRAQIGRPRHTLPLLNVGPH